MTGVFLKLKIEPNRDAGEDDTQVQRPQMRVVSFANGLAPHCLCSFMMASFCLCRKFCIIGSLGGRRRPVALFCVASLGPFSVFKEKVERS